MSYQTNFPVNGRDTSLFFDRSKASGLSGAPPRYTGVIASRLAKLRRSKAVLDWIARMTPRRVSSASGNPRRIGVLLQWGIGDAVLALPLLSGLARSYPAASIELIGKPWLADLFGGEPWLGATHELVPPWSKPSRKYRLWDSSWRRYLVQLLALRKLRFDLLVGLRLDPREIFQLRLLRAGRTVGVAGAGGEAWISDLIKIEPEDYYIRYRGEYNALACRELTGCKQLSPLRFDVAQAAGAAALERLRSAGYAGGPIVCVHNGAGNPIREWRPASFAAVLDSVSDLAPFAVIIDDGADPAGPHVKSPASLDYTVWKSNLTDLKALLSIADVLFCTDSGVMHLGAACGCRVVAIFGPGSPEAFFPREEGHKIVKVEPMPCRPCLDNCIYRRPICMDGITKESVSAALRGSITLMRRTSVAL